jgi:acetyl-CoA acyltransferase
MRIFNINFPYGTDRGKLGRGLDQSDGGPRVVGVEPATMGHGPVPATERLLARTGLSIEDIDAIEMNEAFAVQCVAFLNHFGLRLDSDKVNPYGGAIALGHPLAMSGARLTQQLAHRFRTDDTIRYGITTLCVGLGMGCTVLWERA